MKQAIVQNLQQRCLDLNACNNIIITSVSRKSFYWHVAVKKRLKSDNNVQSYPATLCTKTQKLCL